MTASQDEVFLDQVIEAARHLPREALLSIIAALAQEGPSSAQVVDRAVAAAGGPAARDRTARLLQTWRSHERELSRQTLALGLQIAARAHAHHAAGESIDLVWTGPAPPDSPYRRTDQALLQLIGEAKESLTLVTYIAYRVEAIASALVEASKRGTRLRIISESPEEDEGKTRRDVVRALGPEVAERAVVYYWPEEMRPLPPGGGTAVLHVKCAVADRRCVLLTSANLTEYALSVNMEMGLLVRGGPIPGLVEKHFDELVQNGTFQAVRG